MIFMVIVVIDDVVFSVVTVTIVVTVRVGFSFIIGAVLKCKPNTNTIELNETLRTGFTRVLG